jgi:hypothetical protein
MSDYVVYAPTDTAGPLPSIVALVAALSALVQIAVRDSNASVEKHREEFQRTFDFLRAPEPIPDLVEDEA